MLDTVISARQLAQRLGEANLAIVDCRFDLTRPRWGEHAYAEARIPGALYAHLDRDLSGTPSSATGRHPLPASGGARRVLRTLGYRSAHAGGGV
ncbi:Thiosulfate sulfurtransferase [mine drainage metagenome]|uniref:Thiosulfate sulfurtransferase n=1 Tax=mine drainage metagenome TaxID=410659 RepID=T0ZRP4_9ZZZZ